MTEESGIKLLLRVLYCMLLDWGDLFHGRTDLPHFARLLLREATRH